MDSHITQTLLPIHASSFIFANSHLIYFVNATHLQLCVTPWCLLSTPNPLRIQQLSIPAKPPDSLLLSILRLFFGAFSDAPSFCVSKWIPPQWWGMWCKSSDRGTLISEIYPGGLLPASSASVQTVNFLTTMTRITAQSFSVCSHSMSHPFMPLHFFISLSVSP